mgnify:CR=1 FL=1
MERRRQPKTGAEMQQMRKKRNLALVGVIAGLVVLFYVLTLVKIGGATRSRPTTALCQMATAVPWPFWVPWYSAWLDYHMHRFRFMICSAK